MKYQKRNIIISTILTSLAIIFTILVQIIDVQPVGVNNTKLGFATINKFIFNTIGVNKIWHHITDFLGIIPIIMAIIYALIGIIQLIKRKSIIKIDKEIILLGLFYITVIIIYIFFEKYIINYRPVILDKTPEASYPSSHTLLTICLCGSSVLINNKKYSRKKTKKINIILLIVLTLTVIGRLLSGVHWFTDIIGGILISSSLLSIFNTLLSLIPSKKASTKRTLVK